MEETKLKEFENKLKEISLSNEDLGKYGDGFEKAMELVNNAFKEQFFIQGVMPSLLFVRPRNHWNITIGKKYTPIKKEGDVYTIINDLGKEELFHIRHLKKAEINN